MPWQEESTMELRRQFIQDVQSGATPVTELCTAYQISRKTGYKWLARYDAGGRPALQDRSRAPHSCPHKFHRAGDAAPPHGAAAASRLGPGEARAMAGAATS